MTTPTAAGWYEDPQDPAQLRYFDGVVWSTHTTPRVSPTAASSTIGHAPDVGRAADRTDPAARGGWGAPPTTVPRQHPAGDRLPDGDVLAPWHRRLLARIVDAIVTGLVSGLLALPFTLPLASVFEDYFSAALSADAATRPDPVVLQDALLQVTLPVTLIGLAVGLLYEVAFLVWRGATPGKMLLGTLVRPAAAPGPVSVGVALRRQVLHVVTTVSTLNALLGFFGFALWVLDPAWLLWDPRRQALHDKVADTVVVLKR